VTSYDVAEYAGVSQSAVSRCFKPGASVSKKMRERVMKAVEELGYQPNAIARGLITRRSNIVAVIVSNLSVYPEVLSALSREFSEQGVRVLLFTLSRESDVRDVIMQVLQYQVDGVISAAHLDANEAEAFKKRNIPLVFFNRSYSDYGVSSVMCDQWGGEKVLVDLLLRHPSHRRFAVVAGPEDSIVATQRSEGALRALKHHGINRVTTVAGDYSYDSGWQAALTLWGRKNRPDAILCANDMMAFGVLDALRYELDVPVPKDVSVVGFDGTRPGRWASFALTTVRQPVEQMAAAAVSLLLERVEEPALGPEQRLFPGELISGKTHRLT
jgi:DNA-binding LacI/PurR family transcriptional regulator